jgi:hypothetical protein
MAITNAQQYQQLVKKRADGERPGYVGRSYAEERTNTGRSPGHPSNRTTSPSTNKATSTTKNNSNSNDGGSSINSTVPLRKPEIKKPPKGKDDNNNFLDVFNPFSKKNQKFKYNLALGLPGQRERIEKYRTKYAEYLEEQGIQVPENLLDMENLGDYYVDGAFDKNKNFIGPSGKDINVPYMDYGEFMATKMGSPTIKYSGNVGD